MGLVAYMGLYVVLVSISSIHFILSAKSFFTHILPTHHLSATPSTPRSLLIIYRPYAIMPTAECFQMMRSSLISNASLLCQARKSAYKLRPRRCMTSSTTSIQRDTFHAYAHSILRSNLTQRANHTATQISHRFNHTMASILPAELVDAATKVANLLKTRGETVSVCETV